MPPVINPPFFSQFDSSLLPCSIGGTGPQPNGGTGPQLDGGTGPQLDGGTGPQLDGGTGPQLDGFHNALLARLLCQVHSSA